MSEMIPSGCLALQYHELAHLGHVVPFCVQRGNFGNAELRRFGEEIAGRFSGGSTAYFVVDLTGAEANFDIGGISDYLNAIKKAGIECVVASAIVSDASHRFLTKLIIEYAKVVGLEYVAQVKSDVGSGLNFVTGILDGRD